MGIVVVAGEGGAKERHPTEESPIQEVERALAAEDTERERESKKGEEDLSILKILESPRLPQVLRWLGTAALVVAATTYMIQGVSLADTAGRHWTFLFVTAILGALGVYFGLAAKEVKGGRTFLGIVAATVPVHFSQLGGMIYSLVGKVPANMPEALIFTSTSAKATAVTVAATIALLAPFTYFCFAIFTRPRALSLTASYFLVNAAILLPMREGGIAAAVIVLTAAMIRGADYYLFTGDARLRSFEGLIVRCMFATIILTMIGRNLFYPIDTLYTSMLMAAGGFALLFDAPRFLEGQEAKTFSQTFGSLTVCIGWILFSLGKTAPVDIPSADVYVIFLPVAALLYGFSHFSQASRAGHYRTAASLTALITLGGYQLAAASTETSLATFIGGCVLIGLGVIHAQKGSFLAGVFGVVIGLSHTMQFASGIFTKNLWLSLSITGICILVIASFFEMKGGKLKAFLDRHRARIMSWS